MTTAPKPMSDTKKRTFQGVVVRVSGAKTISVEVARLVAHPLYGKRVRRTKKYLVHDEQNVSAVGDVVRIRESRPISRRKRWILVKKEAV